jgi:hypothetical protein
MGKASTPIAMAHAIPAKDNGVTREKWYVGAPVVSVNGSFSRVDVIGCDALAAASGAARKRPMDC